jgi:hypothetical protein
VVDLGVKMKKFDVFQLPDGSYRAIKYGFSWPSLFLTWIWCFFVARLYGWGSIWIGVFVVGRVIGRAIDQTNDSSDYLAVILISGAIEIGFAIWFASNANEYRRSKYLEMGYVLVQKLIEAPNSDQAISIARQGNDKVEVGQTHPEETAENSHRTPNQIDEHLEGPISSGGSQITSSTETIPPSTPTSPQRAMEMTKEIPTDVAAKNDPTSEISNATESVKGWSEEFQILNEYDASVKECHDELEDLDRHLAEQFREEVVSDRKKAAVIRDRLKAEHEKQINPYTSEALNVALAEARLLGLEAEEEFTRVVEVMGEDIEVEDVLRRLEDKYGVLELRDLDAEMEYWGIVKAGDKFSLGEIQYRQMDDAIACGQKRIDAFFKNANSEDYNVILTSCGYNLERISQSEFRVSPKLGWGFEGPSITIAHELLPNYIKEKFSPKEIRHHVNFLLWSFDE